MEGGHQEESRRDRSGAILRRFNSQRTTKRQLMNGVWGSCNSGDLTKGRDRNRTRDRQAGWQTDTHTQRREKERERRQRDKEREREGEGGGRETINHRSPSSVLIGTWSFEGLGADSKERTTTNCISVFQRGVLKCGRGFH